jgi:antitoxin MazE
MKAQVSKWGNSLAVRIPRAFAEDLGVGQNSSVELTVEDGCLLIRPSVAPTYELETLLRSATPENLHGEMDQAQAVGKEAW